MFNGRRVIYTDAESIDHRNVIDVLSSAIVTHLFNRVEIQILEDYYKGRQKIVNRVKSIRPEINNKICENHANEIVAFKTGYLLAEPVQYIARKGRESSLDDINYLNDCALLNNKEALDKRLANWFHICGTAYRISLPREKDEIGENEAPFRDYVLNPKNTFVIYSSSLGHEPMAGVKYIYRQNGTIVYSVWTKDWYYEIIDGEITNEFKFKNDDGSEETFKGQPHSCSGIPIIEYPLNDARLGAFEIVIDILDAMNMVASNRIDAIEQFVQSLMLFCNCDIDEETFKSLKELGALKYKSDSSNPAKVEILSDELNQMQTQTLVDYMYDVVLVICGMPNRNGGSSTSDTGAAVIMRDGWSAAETRAKDTESMFCEAETKYLRLILSYIKEFKPDFDLPLVALRINFTRRNYENIATKSQVLINLLGCDKVHPLYAYIACGMFPDPEEAYNKGMEYYEQNKGGSINGQTDPVPNTNDGEPTE